LIVLLQSALCVAVAGVLFPDTFKMQAEFDLFGGRAEIEIDAEIGKGDPRRARETLAEAAPGIFAAADIFSFTEARDRSTR